MIHFRVCISVKVNLANTYRRSFAVTHICNNCHVLENNKDGRSQHKTDISFFALAGVDGRPVHGSLHLIC